ncbi:PGC-1 and ERR-induced regulator in muscle protein 1 [Pelobates fuscus]|uniref:PGC-1 and ERR-induced regulator in muscle protein 1 n=1 Tax=Pelobates fuscus TaxID=191477 RepID=UPI002FE49DD8
MDNFEYSIQISDRDWAEFYSTAEECGLMQVSLAAEEELLFSDPEHDDNTSNPKFIRVSLCPPKEEHPNVQSTPTGLSTSDHACNKRTELSEDVVLSGSEDEEDFGSVSRFLCQREALLYKGKNAESSEYIPVTNKADIHYIDKPNLEQSEDDGLVDHMKSLNWFRKQQYEGEIIDNPSQTLIQRNNIPLIGDEDENLGQCSKTCVPSVQTDVLSRTIKSMEAFVLQHKTDDSLDGDRHPLINDHGFHLPEGTQDRKIKRSAFSICPVISPVTSELEKSKSFAGCFGDRGEIQVPQYLTVKENQEQYGHVNTGKPVEEHSDSSKHGDIMEDNDHKICVGLGVDTGLQTASKARLHSSAVKQNVPDPPTRLFTLLESVESTKTSSNNGTTNEFDTGFQRVCTSSSRMLPNNHVPSSSTEKNKHHEKPSVKLRSMCHKDTALTTPEMYDFFFGEISETADMDTKPETPGAQHEDVMYTPDMYEYFFLESKGEGDGNKSEDKKYEKDEPSTDFVLMSPERPESHPSSEDFCTPDAYEFFFADGEGEQSNKENVLSGPVYHAQSAAVASLQSFLPQRLCNARKGFTTRGSRYRTDRDGQLLVTRRLGTTEDSAVALTGSQALRIPAGTGDACLVLLAFASWAVKSSDLQSSDGWKTALLANIGAVSAIRYLRRNSRRCLQESPSPSGEGP